MFQLLSKRAIYFRSVISTNTVRNNFLFPITPKLIIEKKTDRCVTVILKRKFIRLFLKFYFALRKRKFALIFEFQRRTWNTNIYNNKPGVTLSILNSGVYIIKTSSGAQLSRSRRTFQITIIYTTKYVYNLQWTFLQKRVSEHYSKTRTKHRATVSRREFAKSNGMQNMILDFDWRT